MATGSRAASIERLRAAEYRTGQPIFKSRCDGCACGGPPAGLYGLTRHDMSCSHHRAPVKTHGHCNEWNDKLDCSRRHRPIIFSSPMVRAILAGTKTQTRRICKAIDYPFENSAYRDDAGWPLRWDDASSRDVRAGCPYGQPGDRLWVRESFDFIPAGGPDEPQACEIVYWADGSLQQRAAPPDYNPMIYGYEKVRPSIHMPRWASRILLEIVNVRVERLQDISEADATAEGTPSSLNLPAGRSAVENFYHLWASIHGQASWDANPWVWVVLFQPVERGDA